MRSYIGVDLGQRGAISIIRSLEHCDGTPLDITIINFWDYFGTTRLHRGTDQELISSVRFTLNELAITDADVLIESTIFLGMTSRKAIRSLNRDLGFWSCFFQMFPGKEYRLSTLQPAQWMRVVPGAMPDGKKALDKQGLMQLAIRSTNHIEYSQHSYGIDIENADSVLIALACMSQACSNSELISRFPKPKLSFQENHGRKKIKLVAPRHTLER